MKNSNDTIGNRTRELPTCSAVPQPIALLRAPLNNTNKKKTHTHTHVHMYHLQSFALKIYNLDFHIYLATFPSLGA